MIVDALDVDRAPLGPAEAESKLVVHSDGMPPRTVAREGFEPIVRWREKVAERNCRIEHLKLALENAANRREPTGLPTFVNRLGLGATEGLNHYRSMVTDTLYVKRTIAPVRDLRAPRSHATVQGRVRIECGVERDRETRHHGPGDDEPIFGDLFQHVADSCHGAVTPSDFVEETARAVGFDAGCRKFRILPGVLIFRRL